MLMQRHRILVTLIVVSACCVAKPWRLDAQERSSAHLKGLTGVVVHVDTGAYRHSTLSMTQIETDVVDRLRQAGIGIAFPEAPRPYGTQGNLWVNVMELQVPGGSQSFLNIQLRMYGSVVLAGSNERTEAITWETGRIMPISTTDADARVRDIVSVLIDEFSKAYLSVNPKP
jgi:hypothetical protein